jgi:hypothetical protein
MALVEKKKTKMNKTIEILLVLSGVGLLVWFFTRKSATVVVPQRVNASTGTMGLIDQFFPAFNRVPTPGVGQQYNRSGEKIAAISGAVQTGVGLLEKLGGIWGSWSNRNASGYDLQSEANSPSSHTEVPKYESYYDTGFEDFSTYA